MYKQSMNHTSLKKGLDVMKSQVCIFLSVYVDIPLPSPTFPPPLPTLLSLPFHPPSHLPRFLPSKLLLWNTLSAAHTISPCSNHPERYSMNNGGLVPSSSPSRQTQETIFYDTPLTKKRTVSTKYDISHYVRVHDGSCIEEVGCDHMIVTLN